MDRCRLIRLGVYVLRDRGIALVRSTGRSLAILQELQASLDVNVGRVQVGCALVGIEGIGRLVVAGFILEHGQLGSLECKKNKRHTSVPRSYQTSEMLGFRRIAREYASKASRYWLIW